MEATTMILNEKIDGRISRLINKENHSRELIPANLKKQLNPIIIQNNHTICYICQKEMAVEYCKTFSCNHLICIACISKLIIREHFDFFSKSIINFIFFWRNKKLSSV